MEQVGLARSRRDVWAFRSGVAAAALCAGMALAPIAGVAWADDSGAAGAAGSVSASATDAGPASSISVSRRSGTADASTAAALTAREQDEPDRRVGRRAVADRAARIAIPDAEETAKTALTPRRSTTVSLEAAPPATTTRYSGSEVADTLQAPLRTFSPGSPAEAGRGATGAPAVAVESGTVDTTPSPPQPLSPIAQLLEIPGRAVNDVLQVLDLTASSSGPQSVISLRPLNDVAFGTLRGLERQIGLWDTPPEQPAVPTLVYTGPTTGLTPTVAQFLDASSAAYVLGSTPGGMKPFTANGFQMSATNIFTGMAADAWVTPQSQIIIAYEGTTGGTNLLFNPWIAISQIIVDLQVILTSTTPRGFYDAVDFAEEVRAQAALQGYDSDDIFVTGHSLGGWQAQFVAQQIGLAGIGFEAPGMNTTVPGNGADSMFVNIATYGDTAPFMSTDLPGVQPLSAGYVPGGGNKPHYGPIVLIGDPAAMTPIYNGSELWGRSLIGSLIYFVTFFGNFFQYHLPAVQAYYLDVAVDPVVMPWLGSRRGPVLYGYGDLTIPELLKEASDDGILFQP